MKVRFNKGPWHRKVRDVDPRDVARGRIDVAMMDTRRPVRVINDTNIGSFALFNHKVAVYTPVMVTIDLGDGPRQIPSVYPDGAICFEHKETF